MLKKYLLKEGRREEGIEGGKEKIAKCDRLWSCFRGEGLSIGVKVVKMVR